jgi:cysteine-rich repeat protein
MRPQNFLSHPLFLGNLALLLLNDHVLKGAGVLPNAVTGKLSDVAGMFVAPVLLALLCRVRSKSGVIAAHVAVGVVFSCLELWPSASTFASELAGFVGWRWVATADWTDVLTTLTLVPACWLVLREAARPSDVGARAIFNQRSVGFAASLACAASTGTPEWSPTDDNDLDGFLGDVDCNDFDALVNPGAGNCPGEGVEACSDGVDNNGDGAIDCADPDCSFACEDTFAACGIAQPLLETEGVLIGSTLQNATWALEGTCGGADSPEMVISLSVLEPTLLTVEPPEGHVVYLRQDCTSGASELRCVSSEEDFAEGAPVLQYELTPSLNYTLVFDAIDGFDAADFEAPFELETLYVCGDGFLDPNEECDDGNFEDGDYCSSLCTITEPSCFSIPELPLGKGETPFLAGTVELGSSCNANGLGDPERAFWFTAPAAGTLSVSVNSDATNLWLSTRLDVGEIGCPSSEFSCIQQGIIGSSVSELIPLEAEQRVLVMIEGYGPLLTPESTLQLDVTFNENPP